MEQLHRRVDTKELLDAYRELLPQVDTLPLLVSGNSMSPFLVHERDTVYLAALKDQKLHTGDIVLYQRDDGSYILHRICGICNAPSIRYNIIGDAHVIVEKGVRRDQIFAFVKWVDRKGRKLAPGSFRWEFFARVWVRIIPARPLILRVYTALHRVFGRRTE